MADIFNTLRRSIVHRLLLCTDVSGTAGVAAGWTCTVFCDPTVERIVACAIMTVSGTFVRRQRQLRHRGRERQINGTMTLSTDFAQLTVLADALAEQDVAYLRVAGDVHQPDHRPPRPSAEKLIRELAKHPEPRVRESLIPLFLRHPALHRFVPVIVLDLDAESAQTLRHLYTAAVYQQHLWRGAISIYLGEFEILPDYYGESMFQLPSPQYHFGEAGLRQLATHFQRETGMDWLTTYEAAVTNFLAQQSLAVP